MIKRTLLIFLAAILVCLNGAADDKKQRSREDLNKRISYEAEIMMRQLGLKEGSGVGEAFKELYIQYQTEMDKVFHSPELIHRKEVDGKKQPLTDDEIDRNNRTKFTHAENIVKVRRKYYDKFRKYLSAKDMENFFECERRLMFKAKSEAQRRSKYRHQRNKTCKKK